GGGGGGPAWKAARLWTGGPGSAPATDNWVLLPGAMGRSSACRHAGWPPATANWTNTDSAEDGGTLYRATSGLAVGVTTASDPVTRVGTSSVTTAEGVSVAA